MKIFTALDAIADMPGTAVALGNFDGVHLGHSELIRRTVRYAEENGIKSAVFTFSNHPQNVMAGRIVVKSILSREDKIKAIGDLGVDYLYSIPFDDDFHAMQPQTFIDELLLQKFHAASVSCGFNFHFGKNASGGSEFLRMAGESEHFDVEILEPYVVEGNLVSSSLIRKLIEGGSVDVVERYLGRRFFLRGKVVRGDRVGHELGFPTANMDIPETIVIPHDGVYASFCEVRGETRPAMTNIGFRPTVDGVRHVIETHVIEAPGEDKVPDDFYGEEICVTFVSKLRDETTFNGKAGLSAQLDADRAAALKILWLSPFDKTC